MRASDAVAAIWDEGAFALAHPGGRIWRAEERDVRTLFVRAVPNGFRALGGRVRAARAALVRAQCSLINV